MILDFRERALIAFAVCVCATLSGCALFSRPAANDEHALRKRVAGYWEAVVAGDAQAAFQFFEPAAQNDRHRARYVSGMRSFEYLQYMIEAVHLEGPPTGRG